MAAELAGAVSMVAELVGAFYMAVELARAVIAGVRISKTVQWIMWHLWRQPELDHCATSGGWTNLPSDLLGCILQLLELPDALAVAAVCTSWSSAAVAAGVPHARTPWLISWQDNSHVYQSIEFRNLLTTHKTYKVSLPDDRPQLDWCGASHGWLAASDEFSNLVLYHPFTFNTIALPPITDLECVKGVYNTEGSLVGYRYGKDHQHSEPGVQDIGTWFYQKVVLSSDPSQGGDYTAMIIHYDANWVSFARAKEGCWRFAAALADGSNDRYADCVYHNGRFYTVTLRGVLEAWDLRGAQEPSKEVIIANGDKRRRRVLTRFLVSTPCGRLLHIRTLRRNHHPMEIKVQVLEVDVEEHKLVGLSSSTAFQDHAVFVGLNQSVCLPTKEFPELKPNCVYFTPPRLVHRDNFGLPGWRGVGIYNFENQKFEYVFSSFGPDYSESWPTEIWYIPGI